VVEYGLGLHSVTCGLQCLQYKLKLVTEHVNSGDWLSMQVGGRIEPTTVSEGLPIHNNQDPEEPESDRRCGIGH
jgi:hypothetical protein